MRRYPVMLMALRLAIFVLLSGCVSPIDLEGRECPCVPGYVCNSLTQRCEVAGVDELDGGPADVGRFEVGGEAAIGIDAAVRDVGVRDAGLVDTASIDTASIDIGLVDMGPVSTPDAAVHVWRAGSYGSCSNDCGDGIRTRAVECVTREGHLVSPSWCTEPRPDDSDACSDNSGCSYGAWTSGGGCFLCAEERTRICMDSGGAEVPCGLCGGNCSETVRCSGGFNTVGGTISSCTMILETHIADCEAAGCAWNGPSMCTPGGSPSNPTAPGGFGTCG